MQHGGLQGACRGGSFVPLHGCPPPGLSQLLPPHTAPVWAQHPLCCRERSPEEQGPTCRGWEHPAELHPPRSWPNFIAPPATLAPWCWWAVVRTAQNCSSWVLWVLRACTRACKAGPGHGVEGAVPGGPAATQTRLFWCPGPRGHPDPPPPPGTRRELGEARTEFKDLGRERGQRPQTSPTIAGLIKYTDEDGKVNTRAGELQHCHSASWQIFHVSISWHPAQVFRATSSPPDLPASASERKSLGFTDFLTKSEGETF